MFWLNRHRVWRRCERSGASASKSSAASSEVRRKSVRWLRGDKRVSNDGERRRVQKSLIVLCEVTWFLSRGRAEAKGRVVVVENLSRAGEGVEGGDHTKWS